MSIFKVDFAGEKRWQNGWVIVKADSEEEARTKATKYLDATKTYQFTLGWTEELKLDKYDVLCVCK